MSTDPQTPPGEAPEAAPDGTMPNTGAALDDLVSALGGLDNLAAFGVQPNRAMRRAMKRANRKKGK